jgi:integrating conjugative element protein (TIGR03759 family)
MMRALALASIGCLFLVRSTTAVETTQTPIEPPKLDSTQNAAVERAHAKQWGLGLDEYQRAQTLLHGFTGSVADPRITPIEVLGINARNDAERQKYAEQFARLMFAYAERALQFELAYQQAAQRHFGAAPVIQTAPAAGQRPSIAQVLARTPSLPTGLPGKLATAVAPPAMSMAPTLGSGDRLILFAATKCASCGDALERATAWTKQGVVVDLYVVGAQTDAEVARYAQQAHVDPRLVSAGSITLNRDNGAMARVLPNEAKLPQIVRKRGVMLTQLSASEL